MTGAGAMLRCTTVCIASGPSLTQEQCAQAIAARDAGRCSIVVVNNSWQRAMSADILYACDGAWWSMHAAAVRAGFLGQCWTRRPIADADGTYNAVERQHLAIVSALPWLECIPALREPGLGRDGAICLAGNGGHQAINLAYLFGARRILLIGYDMKRGPRGEAHWHGDHPKPLTQGLPNSWIRGFEVLAKDAIEREIRIINCSTATALTCFPRATLEAVL